MSQPVRYWPIADIRSCSAHVRFRGFSGHSTGLQLKLSLWRNGFCEIWPAIRGEKPGFG
jgi:hypothetical protein